MCSVVAHRSSGRDRRTRGFRVAGLLLPAHVHQNSRILVKKQLSKKGGSSKATLIYPWE
jgi:hypothetical protein